MDRDDTLLRLTLDAPPGNLLDLEMIACLRQAIADAKDHKDLKAVVLEGAGQHFSFGASILEHRPGEVERSLPEFHALFRDLFDWARPLIAVVRGNCVGGGLELAAVCNWIFAAPNARFGLPEIRLGVFPPLGSLLLAERVGRAAAEALCVTGQILTAEEALATNLIDHMAEDPAAAAETWIEKNLLPQSAVALQHAVRAVRLPIRESFMKNLEQLERLYLESLMQTKDASEGISAFLEKRPPRWQNK